MKDNSRKEPEREKVELGNGVSPALPAERRSETAEKKNGKSIFHSRETAETGKKGSGRSIMEGTHHPLPGNLLEALRFRAAERSDAEAVWQLYRSQLGRSGCAWDESYPARENIADDLAARALYCLSGGNGLLLGAGTIRHWEEHDSLPFWDPRMTHPCDLMRICTRPELQGRGLGALLLRHLIHAGRDAQYDGMRILVSRNNLPAIRLYRSAGAVFRGETRLYEIDWLCCELLFEDLRRTM